MVKTHVPCSYSCACVKAVGGGEGQTRLGVFSVRPGGRSQQSSGLKWRAECISRDGCVDQGSLGEVRFCLLYLLTLKCAKFSSTCLVTCTKSDDLAGVGEYSRWIRKALAPLACVCPCGLHANKIPARAGDGLQL